MNLLIFYYEPGPGTNCLLAMLNLFALAKDLPFIFLYLDTDYILGP